MEFFIDGVSILNVGNDREVQPYECKNVRWLVPFYVCRIQTAIDASQQSELTQEGDTRRLYSLQLSPVVTVVELAGNHLPQLLSALHVILADTLFSRTRIVLDKRYEAM